MRKLGFWLAGIGFAALFISVGLVAAPMDARAESVLNRGNGAEPESLDPHKATGVPEANIIFDMLEGLTTRTADAQVGPGMASSWEVSDDGTVYTFHLRDAKWSNGDPVTADDFVFSFQRAVSPATASDYAPILSVIKNADAITKGDEKDLTKLGVEAVDPKTVKITLNASTPYFLGLLAHNIAFPVHKATVEKFGDKWTRPGNSVVNGPYMIQEWTPQSRIVLVKNPNYYDAANVKIDKIIYYPTEDVAEELKRFRAGELDVTYEAPSDQIKWAEANLKDEFHNTPYLGTYYYIINLTRDPLGKDLKLRQALSMAIDRDILTEKITQGGEVPAYSWVPPGIAGYTQQKFDYAGMSAAERIEAAKKLYAEAGYGPDKPLKVEILYNTNENHRKIAVAIAAMWHQFLGVDATLTNQEWKVYLDTRDKKDFQIARAAWIGDYPDPINFLDMFESTAGNRNDAGYNNPKYDDLLKQSATTADPQARFKLLEQAEKTFLDDQAIIPIYHYTTKQLVSKKVSGWQDNILGLHLTRYLSING
jgi:oligopeptide transport system substrate-binding protein